MPTYEYRCPKGHEFEHFFRTISSSESRMTCPDCGEIAERKMSGGSGLLFKGSGFYITDYGKDGKKDQRKAAGSSKSQGSSSEGGSSGESSSSGGESGNTRSSGDKSRSEKSSGEKSSGEKSSGDKSRSDKSSSKGSGSSDS